MQTANFESGSVVYLDIEKPHPANGAFEAYVKDWMSAVRDGNYYPGVYGSYLMVDWLKILTSAIWTVELPKSVSDLRADIHSTAVPRSHAPGTPSVDLNLNTAQIRQLADANIMAYDPTKNPHGVIRPGCIATQYLWYQKFDVPLPPGTDNNFDLNFSKVADPSNTACIAQALNIKTLI
jgi:hypothetical protein